MFSRPKRLIISDSKAKELLSNFKAIKVLQVFSIEPKSISQAASELQVSISNCQYWVKQFLKQGLLSIAMERKRAGSAIKYYWLAADELIVDLEPALLETFFRNLFTIHSNLALEGLPEEMLEPDLKYKIQVLPNCQGYLRYRLMKVLDNQLVLSTTDLLRPESSAFLARFGSLQLSHADAKGLQREMFELIDKYRAKTVLGQKTYFFQTVLVAQKD